MDNHEYEGKKARERAWYEQTPSAKPNLISRLLHHPIFYDPGRDSFNYVFPKRKMAELVRHHSKGERVDRLLIAPCGMGDDLTYVGDFARQVYGIDLSPIAVEQCPSPMISKVGDISRSEYEDEAFDLIVSAQFFHHLLKFCFEPFLEEFYRILRIEGKLIILEPSIWYPLNVITRPLKCIAGNPFNEVVDEGPFRPSLMLESLRQSGFVNVTIQAASFSHCSFYTPVAKLINRLTEPLMCTWPFKYIGWYVLYCAVKPPRDATERTM